MQTITAGSEILRYSYDDRDRLTRACAVSSTSSTCLGGTTFNQSYTYDLVGNLTNKAGVAYTYPTNHVRPPRRVHRQRPSLQL